MLQTQVKKLIAIVVLFGKKIPLNDSKFSFGVKIKGEGGVLLNKVTLRSHVKIYVPHKSEIFIGEGSDIGDNSVISALNKIVIGKHVLTGPHVYIADHNHKYTDVKIPIMHQGVMSSPNSMIIIGDDSWIGTNSVIVGNVRIGKHCVIGANSVVTKDIPDYCVAAGIPAKPIKQYNHTTMEWERIKNI